MRLLVIGGNVFLGRHLVEEALRRDVEVTTFNRGRQNPELFPEVERLRGDRLADLSLLAGRRWDAVVDTCGYTANAVSASCAALRSQVGSYVFISSVLVYHNIERVAPNEASPVLPADPGSVLTPASYGAMKVACERAVLDTFGDAGLVLRCGHLIGPYDIASRARRGELDYDGFAPRFPYWALRADRGGEILAPGPADSAIQLTDVRDLARWTLDALQAGTTGTFNVGAPPGRDRFADLIDATVAGHRDCSVTWVRPAFLLVRGVLPMLTLPCWLPVRSGLTAVDTGRAVAAGLRSRPLAETVRDVAAWARGCPEQAVAAGSPVLSAARERELLDEYATLA
jgi:2'-hydroxyisoflavone reductase